MKGVITFNVFQPGGTPRKRLGNTALFKCAHEILCRKVLGGITAMKKDRDEKIAESF